MMTDAATRFVAPLTFQTLSGRSVYTSIWQAEENHDSQHISLARNCDVLVLAPATANTMAKIAHGICDDLVSTVVCAVPQGVPVVVAPAMNADMWANPITQENVAKLREVLGYHMVGPGEGWQACRTLGAGRMSEVDEIFEAVAKVLG
jgi:phosphopantothenoylcysteine synthetase/decarboxylase